jgi:queuine tRNA-ribosyltransferase
MPVGTQACVKGLTPLDLRQSGARCVLGNTYHLMQRPGADVVAAMGGLHRFIGWDGPILTDSGGFQVFSLASLSQLDEHGVRFRSDPNGPTVELTPEGAIRVQQRLGADIVMPLDVCLDHTASHWQTEQALERTRRWAARSAAVHHRSDQQLFGIVQGGMDLALRRQAARDLHSFDFPGYAIGGLSVGEPRTVTERLIAATTEALPADRPRYLMGVGSPEQLLAYTALGVDLFDCVLPTRLGRTGVALRLGERLNLRRSSYAHDQRPIDPSCDCRACTTFSRASLHSAFRDNALLAARLLSTHNVRTLVRTAEQARTAIQADRFADLVSHAGLGPLASPGDPESSRPSPDPIEALAYPR